MFLFEAKNFVCCHGMFVASLLLFVLVGAATAQDSIMDVFAGEYLESPSPIRQMILGRAKKAVEKKNNELGK